MNGDTYEGKWENGVLEGKGTFQGADGYEYEGGWKNGEKEGKGFETLSSGEIF